MLTLTSPQDETPFSAQTPMIFEYTDIGTGIDPQTLTIQLNNQTVNKNCITTQTQANCTLNEKLPDSQDVTLAATIKDRSDNLSNTVTVQLKRDNDNDGYPDIDDLFPNDPLEHADLDKDGIGDNQDIDRDGDGATNAQGIAETEFRIGSRSGNGNHKVSAKATGFEGEVVFYASAMPKEDDKINIHSGNNQRGAIRQPVGQPFIVTVTDIGNNVVKDSEVIFSVVQGQGTFQNGQQTYTATTDSDGNASVHFVLGQQAGFDIHRVSVHLKISLICAGPESMILIIINFQTNGSGYIM